MTRNLVILGSTGSIGTQALEVVRKLNETEPFRSDPVRIAGLAAGGNAALLEEQIREFHPRAVALYDEKAAKTLRENVMDSRLTIHTGMEGLTALTEMPEADTVLTSLVGMIGVRPTIAAIRAGKDVALANKETLVAAGEIIMPLVEECGVRLLPVDSEHSAIFQCLNGEEGNALEEILLTASGGPFRGRKRADLYNVTKEDALKHPNWSMGAKITTDSATMVNKGLEVIEAMHLFRVSAEQVRVVVQPQSIVHSMVRFADGSVIAQMGLPDMKLPIQYALTYPSRCFMEAERLDFAALHTLSFEEPDTETFRGLALAYEAARAGGTLPTVYNAANEEAVSLFLRDEIGFLRISDLIGEAMASHSVVKKPALDDIFAAQEEARQSVLHHTKKG